MRPSIRDVLSTLAIAAALCAAGCSTTTATLPQELSTELESEGIVRQLDDADIRHTKAIGTDQQTWSDRRLSIVVTKQRVLLHENGKAVLEITPRSTGEYSVRREGGRISLRGGSGRSVRSFAFHPPDDPAGWAYDIRAVIAETAGAKRREQQ